MQSIVKIIKYKIFFSVFFRPFHPSFLPLFSPPPQPSSMNIHQVSFLIKHKFQLFFNNTIVTTKTVCCLNYKICIFYYSKQHPKQGLTEILKKIQKKHLASRRNRALQYYINKGEQEFQPFLNHGCTLMINQGKVPKPKRRPRLLHQNLWGWNPGVNNFLKLLR